jgi:hypothetical protein
VSSVKLKVIVPFVDIDRIVDYHCLNFLFVNYLYVFNMGLCRVCLFVCLFVCLMVFNATLNNISIISWWSVLLVEKTGGLGENH